MSVRLSRRRGVHLDRIRPRRYGTPMPVEDYEVTIGLEVHAQLNTRSKMFCACAAEYGAEPNTLTCPICLGLPGALPVLNQAAIEKTILTGLMLGLPHAANLEVGPEELLLPGHAEELPDHQFDLPLCLGGGVPLYDLAYPKDAQKSIANPGKVVKLTRIHLEEDVAKSTHTGAGTLTIDFNRAGTPLMEIVSEPDIDSAEEAFAYLTSLRQILDLRRRQRCRHGKGPAALRREHHRAPRGPEGTRREDRAEEPQLLSAPCAAPSTTRSSARSEAWRRGEARAMHPPLGRRPRRDQLMRTKEDAHDYRYFPDPDLLPVARPRLPGASAGVSCRSCRMRKCARFVRDYGVSAYDANVLASDQALARLVREAAAAGRQVPAKKIANWVINDLLSVLKESEKTIHECPLPPGAMRELTDLIESGALSGNLAKEEVFPEMFTTGKSAAVIIKEKGLEPLADTGELEGFCDQVIAANASVVDDVKGGNEKAINFLKGQVMKLSKGKANPKAVGEMLEKKLLG